MRAAACAARGAKAGLRLAAGWLALAVALTLLCLTSRAADGPQGAAPTTLPPADGPVVVKMSFELDDIVSIDDSDESFMVTGTLLLAWTDRRLAFDPVVAGTSELLRQGDYQVEELAPCWLPRPVLVNRSETADITVPTLRVKSDGSCRLSLRIAATAEGEFRMRRYPFDRQRLEAVVALPGFSEGEVRLEAGTFTSRAGLRISQWNLLGVSGEVRRMNSAATGATDQVVVTFEVDRDSVFSLRLVVLPLVLIVVLSWSVFWMDRSSLGDRINVSFVGILTAVAYQNVVSDLLPHVSYVTLMHGFINTCTALMAATVVVNLKVGACDKQGRYAEGDAIDRRCRRLFPMIFVILIVVITVIAFALP